MNSELRLSNSDFNRMASTLSKKGSTGSKVQLVKRISQLDKTIDELNTNLIWLTKRNKKIKNLQNRGGAVIILSLTVITGLIILYKKRGKSKTKRDMK